MPREQNAKADAASREADTDNWSIKTSTAKIVQNSLGKCCIDAFANPSNTKCSRFFSRDQVDGTSGVDAFAQSCTSWNEGCLWCVPPPLLALKCIKKLEESKATAVLGIPNWRGQLFFRALTEKGKWKSWVKKGMFFPPGASIFNPGGIGSAFDSPFSKSGFFFIKIDFKNPFSPQGFLPALENL
jgi:hypothetical protein